MYNAFCPVEISLSKLSADIRMRSPYKICRVKGWFIAGFFWFEDRIILTVGCSGFLVSVLFKKLLCRTGICTQRHSYNILCCESGVCRCCGLFPFGIGGTLVLAGRNHRNFCLRAGLCLNKWLASCKKKSVNMIVMDKQNGMRKQVFVSDMSFALIDHNKYRYYRDLFHKGKSFW